MSSNRIAMLASLTLAVLGGCSAADQQAEAPVAAESPMAEGTGPAPAADAATTPAAAEAAGTASESRIFIDAATGEARAPTAAELAAAQAAESGDPAVRQQQPKIEGTRLPDGTIRYDLRNQPQIEEKVCVQADGSIGPCPAK